MTTCPEIVETVTGGGGFPWPLLLIALAVGAWFVYKNGIVGTKASLKALAAKLHAKAQKIEAKWKEKEAKEAATVPVPVAAPAAVRTKGQRIAENNSLLAQGAITKEAADAANAAILREA